MAIGEHGGIVALENAVHKALDARFVEVGLAGLGRNDKVEGEHLIFANHDLVRLGCNAHTRLMLVEFFALAQRSHLQKFNF